MITIPGRIPISIHPFFWILIFLIGWMSSYTLVGTLIWALVIFFSVLIHEYGHALTALAFGQKAHIELVGLGGITVRKGPRLKLWKEFIIILNGPLAGFSLYLIASQFSYLLNGNAPEVFKYALFITIVANLFWTIVNLLPIHPLDGGKLLSIILEAIFGIAGVKAALLISAFTALIASIYFFLNQSLIGGALFTMLAFESYRAWQGSRYLSSHDEDTELKQELEKAKNQLQSGDLASAEPLLEEIRKKTEQGLLYLSATELLANLYVKQGRIDKAYETLKSVREGLSANSLQQLQQLAFQNSLWEDVVALSSDLYQLFPTYETALTNALAYSLLNREEPAVGWLQRAIGDGLPNITSQLKRAEFDPIRHTKVFKELEERYSHHE